MPKLNPGETAPSFEALDQDGNTARLSDFEGVRLFMFFYPKADTSG